MKLNQNQLENISETLKDFKSLLNRYIEIKNDPVLLRKFCSRNRNPLFDLTSIKYFSTDLISEEAKKEYSQQLVSDHYIQRSKAIKYIFSEIEKNPQMDVQTFIKLLKKYCSTVSITKKEHQNVTIFSKKNPEYLNYESYLACHIKINGLSEIMMGII